MTYRDIPVQLSRSYLSPGLPARAFGNPKFTPRPAAAHFSRKAQPGERTNRSLVFAVPSRLRVADGRGSGARRRCKDIKVFFTLLRLVLFIKQAWHHAVSPPQSTQQFVLDMPGRGGGTGDGWDRSFEIGTWP